MAVWLLVSFAVEFVLLGFNITVAAFVTVQMIKRNALFSSAFFVIYLVESVVGCTHYDVYTFHIQLQGTDLFPSSWLNPDESAFLLYLTGYFNFFPLSSHTMIALNRYTAIVWPSRHHKMWMGNRIAYTIAILFLFPLIGAFLTCGLKLDFIRTEVAGIVAVCIIFATCVVSAIVEIWTFCAYRRLSATKQREYRDDFRLLIFAIFGMVAHLLAAVMTAGMFFVAEEYPEVGKCLRVFSQYYVDILCFYGPVCLFVSSSQVRKGYLLFYGLRRSKTVTSVIPITTSS